MATLTKTHSSLNPKYFIPLIAVVGLIVGILTPIGQKYFNNNWNTLVNSGAVWLFVAFFVSAAAPSKIWAVIGGLGTLFGAVMGYFLMVPIMTGYDLAILGMGFWLAVALVGGPLFGLAGYWWRTGDRRMHVTAIGLLGGVFLAEGLLGLLVMQQDKLASRWTEVAVGLLLPLILGRLMKDKLLGLAVLPAILLVGVAAYWLIDWSIMNVLSR